MMFRKEFGFLSNFYGLPHPITYMGYDYTTSENAFQAGKNPSEAYHQALSLLGPSAGKELAQQIKIRRDWEDVKLTVMQDVLKLKFQIPSMKLRLIRTGDIELVEGNFWHDNFWGNCTCSRCAEIEGQNYLGKLLMEIRNDVA